MLYIRTILTTGIALYTVRVILDVLGFEDYGLYSVVGGTVALLSFLPNSMASATQRFFSFALGQRDGEKLKRIFSVNLIVYAALSLGSLLVLETVGLWFVGEHLRIPPERYDSVLQLYHYSVLTFTVGIITSPFMAIIIAHEDMHIYAYMAISEALLKLGSVFLLTHLSWDKLELYGLLVLLASVLNTAAFISICLRRYDECQFRKFNWDKSLLKEIMGFTGWTLFGQLTTVARNQAVTILLNQSFNPVVVAARAVSTNIAHKVNTISSNFNVGLYPPIVKSYAAGDNEGMQKLIFGGSKATFFMMWLFALPLVIEMEMVLALWLKNPPPGAILFARLALIEALINAISMPLMTAARAPGKMAMYESVLGSIQIAIFLVSWLVLKMGAAPYSVFVVAIVANGVMFLFRFAIVRRLIGVSAKGFFQKVIIPVAGVVALSSVASLLLSSNLPNTLPASISSAVASGLVCAACIYFLGLDQEWRMKIAGMLQKRLAKLSFNPSK